MSSHNTLNMNDPGRKQPLSGFGIATMGCGAVIVGLLIVAGLGAWWVNNNYKTLGAEVAVSAMKDGLQELDIPADQRQRIHDRIDNVGKKYKDGELEMEQLAVIFARLAESPLLSAGASLFFKSAYLQHSGLSDEDKQSGEATIQRFARGIIDESIPRETTEAALNLISDSDGEGRREFRNKLTDEDLHHFFEFAKQAADDANVSDDAPPINYADEFEKAVDEAMDAAGMKVK